MECLKVLLIGGFLVFEALVATLGVGVVVVVLLS